MRTLLLVLASLYLHQYIGGWSECLMGLFFGFLISTGWRSNVVASIEVGLGWLVAAFIIDQTSDGRVEQIGAVLQVPSIEGTYAITFFVAFLAFFSWSTFGRTLRKPVGMFSFFDT